MVTRRCAKRRYKFIVVIILCIVYCIIQYSHSKIPSWEFTRIYIEHQLAEALKAERGSGCQIPQLDPFAKEIIELESEAPAIECPGQDWVKCYYSECKVVPAILNTTKNIKCIYRDLIYESDQKYYVGDEMIIQGGDTYYLKNSDHVKITCTGKPDSVLKKSYWKGYAAGFRDSVELRSVPPGRENSFNVLIFGYDSTSKNGFIRKMPKSYRYLTKMMKGIVLNGYNIVGDGTPSALFPILTGKTELELPDVRKILTHTENTLDILPFIFYKVKDYGYRTAYLEDAPWYGTFQYRFNGFRNQPTDHYLRPFFLEERRGNWWKRLQSTYCLGDTPQYRFMMNITDQMLRMEGKKFIFTFISDITHDNFDALSNADDDMLNFLENLVKLNVLKNTLVIIMGDHGQRFTDIRNTFQGRLEERLPFMCIFLPEELKSRRPKAQSYLEGNANVLTTPHDIHATLLDVLDLKQYMNKYKIVGADLPRAMSLLEPIPRNRSCSEAGIESHWCACMTWINVSSTNALYKKAVDTFVNYVNFLTLGVRSQCALRTLDKVIWVMQQRARSNLLSYSPSKKSDAYFAKFGTRINHTIQSFHIRVILGPGRAVYEAAMKYFADSDVFAVNRRDISRTSKYGKEPVCISPRLPHLNPYCYCTEDI